MDRESTEFWPHARVELEERGEHGKVQLSAARALEVLQARLNLILGRQDACDREEMVRKREIGLQDVNKVLKLTAKGLNLHAKDARTAVHLGGHVALGKVLMRAVAHAQREFRRLQYRLSLRLTSYNHSTSSGLRKMTSMMTPSL